MKNMTAEELLTAIQSQDPDVRTEAWLSAGMVGAAAIGGLAKLVINGNLETGRAAKRALWKIVRTAGAPDGAKEKRPVLNQLVKLLDAAQPPSLRREVIWMLSEISSEKADIDAVAELLSHPDLREDARCALERIPGDRSLAALKEGFARAPQDFKPNIAHSLRARGVNMEAAKK
ncbi:MAG TPA: HEAT repeat domain-containing protein [Acidobacteriota bacterium]|jgi:HEAT repeat protein